MEFALVFVATLLIVAGLIEFGRAVWTCTTLAHAARQGARFAMTRGGNNPVTAEQVRNVVRNAAIGLDKSRLSVTAKLPPAIRRGSVVEVNVRYDFALVTGSFLLARGPIPLGSHTRAIVAN